MFEQRHRGRSARRGAGTAVAGARVRRQRPGYGSTRSGSVRSSANGRRGSSGSPRSFPECRGLSTEQLEDIYQETALALLRRPYDSEEHLRNALRTGLKHRALQPAPRRTPARPDPRAQRSGHARDGRGPRGPERPRARGARPPGPPDRLRVPDRADEVERRVFGWLVRGDAVPRHRVGARGHRGQRGAQRLSRVRAKARALPAALRHRAGCAAFARRRSRRCRAARRRARSSPSAPSRILRAARTAAPSTRRTPGDCGAASRDEAAALLPPVLVGHLGWLTSSACARDSTAPPRVDTAPAGQGGVRERAVALLAGGGVGAKVAAGVATVAVIAGGTIGDARARTEPAHHRHHPPRAQPRRPAKSRPRGDF